MNSKYLIKKIKRLIKDNKKYLVAYSGGLDSSALLQILFDLNKTLFKNISLRAIHVNHNLNMNSNIWVKHCYLFCKKKKINLIIKNINIIKKKNIEEEARKLRYKIFKKIILNNEILLLGHHLQDQCETFLLSLKRGSGPSGLSCMPFKKKIGNNYLIRPFLNIKKKYLTQYILKKKIKYIIDNSNYNTKFDRNFLRLKILPIINKRWPKFYISIFKSSILCANQENIIYDILKKKIFKIQNKKKALLIDYLKQIKLIKCYLIIKKWINQFNVKIPSFKKIKKIWTEIALSNINSQPKLNVKLYQINRYSKYLYLLPNICNITNINIIWENQKSLILPNNIGKLIINKNEGYILRAPQKNEKIIIKFLVKGKYNIIGKIHSLNIKKIWKELGIHPWLRNKIPLIYYDNKLISAVGVFITKYGNIFKNKKKIKIKFIKNLKI
ncbi:tRNA lysidine(34) synthetase TilS [Enterobacteriaceae bacterium ET-AT1-13]|nr:tRNA lysidine(34) synthetase TilS [Enterobacteriaceae bacterium ET-AT1-13]